MNSQEYMEFHRKMCDKMIEITKSKNADYCGGENATDPFRNFRTPEFFGFASAEQGFLTRMSDKFSRLSTFVQKGILQVKDESVEDSLLDLANYCLLMAGWIKAKRDADYCKTALLPHQVTGKCSVEIPR